MRHVQSWLVVLFAATAGVAAHGFQTQGQVSAPTNDSGLLIGAVVEGLTDVPVPGALVTLRDSAAPPPTRGSTL